MCVVVDASNCQVSENWHVVYFLHSTMKNNYLNYKAVSSEILAKTGLEERLLEVERQIAMLKIEEGSYAGGRGQKAHFCWGF